MRGTHIGLAVATVGLAVLAIRGSNALASDQPALVTYGCREVVVVGRVREVGNTDLTGPDDVLGRARQDVQVTIKRVLRGNERRRLVQARGYSHAQMREDADFWIVLTPTLNGSYEIRKANLISSPYRLAPRCVREAN